MKIGDMYLRYVSPFLIRNVLMRAGLMRAQRRGGVYFYALINTIQIFPRSAPPSHSVALLPVAPGSPLPAVDLTPSLDFA
jgi:hypothetical protein